MKRRTDRSEVQDNVKTPKIDITQTATVPPITVAPNLSSNCISSSGKIEPWQLHHLQGDTLLVFHPGAFQKECSTLLHNCTLSLGDTDANVAFISRDSRFALLAWLQSSHVSLGSRFFLVEDLTGDASTKFKHTQDWSWIVVHDGSVLSEHHSALAPSLEELRHALSRVTAE